ncbi:hypothetical protein EDD16DRAFT_1528510 [Pisolithus croceorrhizus]|nr:hypothetical protein EDD16DRAFT_1528510 [Pisolithus croceorrhizus]
MFNYLATKFHDPTPISIPTKKPIEASSDDETSELCMKPNKSSVELPNEERLKDGLTEARSKGKAEAANELYKQPSLRAGKPLESEHIIVQNGMVEMLDEVKNVDRKTNEALPLKLCSGITTNNMPIAHALLLKGEQAACPSSTVRGYPRMGNGQLPEGQDG